MKSRFHIILLSAALSVCFAACSDLKEIEDRLDSLESRVQAIENLLPALNGNIEVLQKLAGGGTINSVSEKDGEYTLVLSNGDTLRLAQGSIGIGNAPVMTIDSDGYWMVDYGKGAEYLLSGGSRIKAESSTPEIGVDSEGFWTVRYDGADFERLKDESGNPISARPDADSDAFFRSVKVEGDRFVVVTADGRTITLPIEPDFMYAIKRNGAIVTDVVTLLYNEPVIFEIESKGVASVSVVARPDGVEVTLTETGMTVEAVYDNTKASADTRKDIAILAVSANGFASIAKVLVEIDETSMPSTTPRAFISQKAATLTTLTFELKTRNTTTVKYILKPSTETAPSADELTSDMTLVEDKWTDVTFDNLEIDTEYTLYVLPTGGTVLPGESIEMAHCAAKTAAPQPAATVEKTAETYKTLTFSVELNSDATGYWYRLYPENEIPAGNIDATNTSSEATLTFEDLNADTDYVLEVLAVNGEYKAAESVKTPAKTAAPADYYEMYDAGYDVTVGTLTINKSGYGDAILIRKDSENKSIESTGVYFVDSEAEGVSIKADAEKLIILSLDEKSATVTRQGQTAFVATSAPDYFIASNIRYVTNQTSGNVFGAKGDGDFETIIFNKVQIEIPAGMNMIYSAKNIVNLNMTDCDVKLHKGSEAKNIIQTNTTNTYASVVFKNNIFYCTDTDGTLSNFGLFANNNATISSLEFRNNTIAGVYCKATGGYVTAKEITAGDIVSNLFYVPDYSTLIPDKYVGILWLPNGYDDSHLETTIKSNLAFYNNDAVPTYRIKGTYYGGKGQIYNKAKADNPVPAPDYANGVFTQGTDYKSFGAKR